MAIEIKENKKTAKFKVGDKCMLKNSIFFKDSMRNQCEVPFGSVVEIRTVCEDSLDLGKTFFEYCCNDCNGEYIHTEISECDLCLATEETFDEEMDEAEKAKKHWEKQSIKTIVISFVVAVIAFVIGYLEPVLRILCYVTGSLVLLAGAVVAPAGKASVEFNLEDTKEMVERAREELKKFNR